MTSLVAIAFLAGFLCAALFAVVIVYGRDLVGAVDEWALDDTATFAPRSSSSCPGCGGLRDRQHVPHFGAPSG